MITRWLIALLICVGVSHVDAVTVAKGNGLAISRSGNVGSATTGPATSGGNDFSRLMGGTYNPNMVDGAAEFSRLMDMPFKLKDLVPDKATVKAVLTPANIAKGLRGAGVAYLAGEAVQELAKQACVRMVGGTWQMSPNGAWEECVPGQLAIPSDGKRYYAGNDSPSDVNLRPNFPTKLMACERAVAIYGAQRPTAVMSNIRMSTSDPNDCLARQTTGSNVIEAFISTVGSTTVGACPTGQYKLANGTCSTTPPSSETTYTPITQAQAEAKIDTALRNPANATKAADAIKEALDKGAQFDNPNMTISGPASSPAVTSQSTTGSGSSTLTTTNTTTNNYTYNGPNVTVKETTTSVTTNSSGTVTNTSTSSNDPPEVVIDSEMPPVPTLYERKYPNGMEGIWNTYKSQLQGTPLFSLINTLLPNLGDSGTCPHWNINLNYAQWAQHGTHDISPPCWLWDFGRALMILGALLLARALIFGG